MHSRSSSYPHSQPTQCTSVEIMAIVNFGETADTAAQYSQYSVRSSVRSVDVGSIALRSAAYRRRLIGVMNEQRPLSTPTRIDFRLFNRAARAAHTRQLFNALDSDPSRAPASSSRFGTPRVRECRLHRVEGTVVSYALPRRMIDRAE